ncbi:S-layer homology domain-containing protein [Paenibacillus sp. JCM 10914]
MLIVASVAPTIEAAGSSSSTGGTGSGGATYFEDTDHWHPNNEASDFGAGVKVSNVGAATSTLYPIEFKIRNITQRPQESAYLLIRAYDVDEYDESLSSGTGEWDRVYLSNRAEDIVSANRTNEPGQTDWSKSKVAGRGHPYLNEFPVAHYIGALSGQNNTWNTTVLKIDDLSKIKLGDHYVGISIHHYVNATKGNASNWVVEVDWAQLIIDGGSRTTGEITNGSFTIDKDGNAVVESWFTPKEQQHFSMEMNIVERDATGNEQNLTTVKKFYDQDRLDTGEESKGVSLEYKIPGYNPNNEYFANIILFEDSGTNNGKSDPTDPQSAQHIYSISTFDPKVSDIEKNDAPQYEPTSFSLQDFEQKFAKVNGVQDNTLEKIKIVSLPDAATGRLTLDGRDVMAGQEIPVNQVQELVFQPDGEGGFNGTTAFRWNGYDQAKQKYAAFDADVVLTPKAAPILTDLLLPVNKGESKIEDMGERIKQIVPDGLEYITVLSVPAKGKLVTDQGDVLQGDQIPWDSLDTLQFVPEDEHQTGTVTWTWNGWDGIQHAKDYASVKITINTPPVALDVAKAGFEGQPVVIPASEFQITDADGDRLKFIQIQGVDAAIGTVQYNTVQDPAYQDLTGEISVDGLNSIRFTPALGLPLDPPVVITWTGSDGKQYAENAASITITYNGRPVAKPQTIEAEEGTSSIPITLTGEDAESLTLVYTVTQQPNKGELAQEEGSDDAWIYTPHVDFIGGSDTFYFTVTDEVYQTSEPSQITVNIHRTLDGWVGGQNQGDNEVAVGIPGKPFTLSAVSSLQAQQVDAIVNGIRVPLYETDPNGATARGYRTWDNSSCILPLGVSAGSCVLPMNTSAGLHEVRFEAYNGAGELLPPELRLEDNRFKVVGTDLTMSASPDTLVGDGTSTTVLTAVLKDGDGKPVEGVTVVFDAPSGQGQFLGASTGVTDETGRASVTFQAPNISGVHNQQVTVTATVDDAFRSLYGQDDITITFQPAMIRGVITEGADHAPVANAVIRVTLDLNGDGVIEEGVDFIEIVMTDEHGAYALPVPQGDATYQVEFTQDVMIGGVRTPVTYTQKAQVDKVAGASEVFDSEKTVTGIVLFKNPDGQTSLLDSSLAGKMTVYLQDEQGNYVLDDHGRKKAFEVGTQGVFSADGLVSNQKYRMEIGYQMEVYDENGPTGEYREILINGKRGPSSSGVVYPEIELTKDGELNIVQDLVDPYGTVTDGRTNSVIEDADVVLYYANTARNLANGIQPNTQVYLPPITGFAPNDNGSPAQKTDANGFYAYMVYPETDYYLTVRKSGYRAYTSPTIPVNWDIVRHDVKLYRPSVSSEESAVPAPSSQTKLAATLNLSIDKNLAEEGTVSEITVNYKNDASVPLSSGTIALTLPEGVEVVEKTGAAVNGSVVTWNLGTLSAHKSGQFKLAVKWPQLNEQERTYDVKGIFTASDSRNESVQAEAGLKVQIFSKRYENLQHQRYILGYPDGEFKPNRSLTRAELAAIVARLSEHAAVSDPLTYTDVESDYWAASYIKIASKQGYFTGFADGSFRPDSVVTRGELATVMTRFLKLTVSEPGEVHFSDMDSHWAAYAVETLYRNKFLAGYADGSFKPNQSINRAEAVTLINRMLFRGPLQGLTPQFPDIPELHWAFGDIQEATVSHESVRNSDGSEAWIKNLMDDVK